MNLVSFGFLALPTIFISLSLLGVLIAFRCWRAGFALAFVSSLCLFAASTPALSSLLLRQAEAGLPQNADLREAQAIVVLSGEVRRGNGADIPDRLGPRTLERLVLAANAYRRLNLPVAVSGGCMRTQVSEAFLMKMALETELNVRVRWTEEESRTTWENAIYTAQLLRSAEINTVVLVTHAWHLPRALRAFEKAGLKALPWPSSRTPQRLRRAEDYLPSIGGLQDSFYALHEIIGSLYYRLRY